MHAVLTSVGTDGDVFPHVGLGAALRARGHRVTLAVPEPYRPLAADLGLGFRPLITAGETTAFLADPDLWHPVRSGPMAARWGGPLIPRQYELLADLARDPDVVLVANPGILAARVVQEKLGRPLATLLLQPGLLPSRAAPPEMPAGLTLPRWAPGPVGRLYWRAVLAAGDRLTLGPLNRLRATLGLPPARDVLRWWLSPDRVIGLFPGWYAPPPADWPPQLRLAGFPRVDVTRGGEVPADVADFCRAGPPIAFTLGTGMLHAARFFRSAVDACRRLGARGLLLTKYPHLLPADLPPGIRHVAFAPFRKLLPRCAAVVHHGGIGTTAAALAAGCPQLLLPMAWDQPDNAARVKRLGVGDWLPVRRRTGCHLAAALAWLTAAGVRERCRGMAVRCEADDGLETAAGWVEELAAKVRPDSAAL